ncbi:hypothetical protein [Phenylobacterium sp.]|jgi:hypothetical protein|uniref:hypothetical protein n=1 Tax=Phenylobacterium sp. TaxID=1871053 RepID=UPI002E2F42FE|nr:hypothetical protein [Phenylobacterium sp.]HEX3367660.1 hypothetical protein [Phenylobacterium sp.]
MQKMQSQTERPGEFDKTAHGRSFAKDIAELALFLELTEPPGSIGHLESATAEVITGRQVPATTLKRCISEARALIEFFRESGALGHIEAQAEGDDWALRTELAAWLDETRLTAVLKQRALRLNRSRGGRPSTTTRTLRAVEELVAFARAGRPGALDELRSIRALVADT